MRRTLLVLLLLAAPLPVLADHTSCRSTLPQVLNLGLPRLPKDEFRADALKRGVQRFMEEFYTEHGTCAGERPLQVNITVASDYEILDWLSQGVLHAAVIPDMTLYLLQRDGMKLRKVAVEGHALGSLLLPDLAGWPVSGQVMNGEWMQRPSLRADLEAFRQEVWNAPEDKDKEAMKNWQPKYRIVLASHLSTLGFLDPVRETSDWLERRLEEIEDEKEREDRRERFWTAFLRQTRFAIGCDSMETCWQPPKSEKKSHPVEILYLGESVLRRDEEARAKPRRGNYNYREHLVMLATTAEEIFSRPGSDGDVPFSEPVRLVELERLFASREKIPSGQETRPLRPFHSILEAEPLFGVRTFSFTADEVIRLLRQDQTISNREALALVLPGGGVKAAYQSRIVDELYQHKYLENSQVKSAPESLKVQYVIGTSGGALLGFFVSQLSEKGPFNLTEILWKRDAKRGLYLRSTDVFGWTDLLRYLSVVASFLVFCALLALASIPERAPLNPANKTGSTAWRVRLTFAVLPLLLAAPLLVRMSNQRSASAKEQIPEFEGLIYAILAMVVMFADQCLVLHKEPRENGRPRLPLWLPVLLGAGLIAYPLLSKSADWVTHGITFEPAYAVLTPVILIAGLIVPLRLLANRFGPGRTVLEVLVPVGLALLLGLTLAGEWLTTVKVPFYITGFALILLLLVANATLRRLHGRAWWPLYIGSLLLASLLVMNLSWPEGGVHGDLSVGTFLVCVGLLVLLLGGIAWAYAGQRKYHLEHTHDFVAGFIVVLIHMVIVALTLWTLTEVLPDRLSPLELTGEFWTWLLGISLGVGLALLLLALYGRSGSRLVTRLRQSFLFLCSHHPNGDFVTRRFLRVAGLAVFSLTWWNLIVAPALYGNRQARAYLTGAVQRFYAAAEVKDGEYRPTARFIAPANVLERDGTRYFVFVPAGDECPQVPGRRLVNGAMWFPYAVGPGPGDCPSVPDRDLPVRVIFASGSPFPIFPAHRVTLDNEEVSLVDGGYSNNVPVDAARTVSAEQVLIVESTNPFQSAAEPSRFMRTMLGMRGELVENLGRLPAFLFERSQQVDRLSRRDLFVVSISPSRGQENWPALFDFRRQTVMRMENVAVEDLTKRVGMVQSWGRPAFVLSVEVLGQPEAHPHEHAEGEEHPHV